MNETHTLDRTDNMSPVAYAIAGHQAALDEVRRLEKADVPDGPIFDDAVAAEVDAMRALVEAPCANDQEFFDKATYILEVANGDQFEETHAVNALEVYLKQRES